jgi:hypothetical protein
MSVNQERVQLLVDALRSGEYKQVLGKLEGKRSDGKVGNCCLGVACRVAIEHGLHVTQEESGGQTLFDGNGGALPTSVSEWYGFEGSNPKLLNAKIRITSGVDMNDGASRFELIANAFERTYLK